MIKSMYIKNDCLNVSRLNEMKQNVVYKMTTQFFVQPSLDMVSAF